MSDLHATDYDYLYHQAGVILEVTEAICRYMKDHNISRDDLIKLLKSKKGITGKFGSRSFVDSFLNEGKNNTIPILADFCYALGADIEVKLVERGRKKETTDVE